MISIFPILIGLAVLILLAWGMIRQFRWKGSVSQPSCAHCNYPVRGLSSFLCPECGRDLREVGIVTPAMRVSRPPGPLFRCIAWTCLLLIVALPTSALVLRALPTYSHKDAKWSFSPGSKAYREVRVHIASIGRAGQEQPGKLSFEAVSLAGAVATQSTSPGRKDWPPQADSVLKALKDAGVDTTQQAVIAEAQDVASCAQELWATGSYSNPPASLSPGGGSTAVFNYPSTAAASVLAALWLALWIVGLVKCIRAARRDLAPSRVLDAGMKMTEPQAGDSH